MKGKTEFSPSRSHIGVIVISECCYCYGSYKNTAYTVAQTLYGTIITCFRKLAQVVQLLLLKIQIEIEGESFFPIQVHSESIIFIAVSIIFIVCTTPNNAWAVPEIKNTI